MKIKSVCGRNPRIKVSSMWYGVAYPIGLLMDGVCQLCEYGDTLKMMKGLEERFRGNFVVIDIDAQVWTLWASSCRVAGRSCT